jgi:hypothetical protein
MVSIVHGPLCVFTSKESGRRCRRRCCVGVNGIARTTMNFIATLEDSCCLSYPPVIQTSRLRRKNFAEGNDLGRPIRRRARRLPSPDQQPAQEGRQPGCPFGDRFPAVISWSSVALYPQPRIPRTTCVSCHAGDPRPSGPRARDLRNPCARTPPGALRSPGSSCAPRPSESPAPGPTSQGAAPPSCPPGQKRAPAGSRKVSSGPVAGC